MDEITVQVLVAEAHREDLTVPRRLRHSGTMLDPLARRNQITFARFLLLWFLIIVCVAALMLLWHVLEPSGSNAGAERKVTPRGDLAADEKSTIAVFEHARGSVVYISTSQLVEDVWTRNIFAIPQGTGSGIIWDSAGDVITNFHVIRGASEATIKLADGRKYRASLVGVSPEHDIAVLRIGVAFHVPPPIPIGTSGDLKVGQKVFAIGNPFGLDWSLTTGIVSALDRTLPDENDGQAIEHLIQTDAAINPGNSGGPLLDSSGRLIGMNTMIYSPSGASAGIGFAVPVDTMMQIVPRIIRSSSS